MNYLYILKKYQNFSSELADRMRDHGVDPSTAVAVGFYEGVGAALHQKKILEDEQASACEVSGETPFLRFVIERVTVDANTVLTDPTVELEIAEMQRRNKGLSYPSDSSSNLSFSQA